MSYTLVSLHISLITLFPAVFYFLMGFTVACTEVKKNIFKGFHILNALQTFIRAV